MWKTMISLCIIYVTTTQWEDFGECFQLTFKICHKPLPLVGSLEGKTLPVWPDTLGYHEMKAATESMVQTKWWAKSCAAEHSVKLCAHREENQWWEQEAARGKRQLYSSSLLQLKVHLSVTFTHGNYISMQLCFLLTFCGPQHEHFVSMWHYDNL